jgi:spore maturation protein CgeB
VSPPRHRFVFFGLSITSSWGNGHATTYRALLAELCRRGHDVLFLERDLPFYSANRDLAAPPFGRTELYDSLEELAERFSDDVRRADVVIIGSYVPEGTKVIDFVFGTARGKIGFYDIDTPVTLAKLSHGGNAEYLTSAQVPRFDIYLSFSGGPILEALEDRFAARRARPLFCSVDPSAYYPDAAPVAWDLGYLGTYSPDRQPALSSLLIEPARQLPSMSFCVAGPQYPEEIAWPPNVSRIEHLSPSRHRAFYNSQRFTLNVTRQDMVRAGHSPSVRLFEAAACGIPIISDAWIGLEQLFAPGEEILLAEDAAQVRAYLADLPEERRIEIGQKARIRVLSEHTAAHRAETLEGYVAELFGRVARGGDRAAGGRRTVTRPPPRPTPLSVAILETSQWSGQQRERRRSKA